MLGIWVATFGWIERIEPISYWPSLSVIICVEEYEANYIGRRISLYKEWQVRFG